MCGKRVIDVETPKIAACKHLPYALLSEAPRMPDYITESVGDF